MSKAQRNREQHARAKIVAQQMAARRAETRRRTLIVSGSVVVVLAVVVAFIIVKSLNHATPAQAASDARTTNVTVAQQITSVPASVLDSVGAGPTGTSAVSPLTTISTAPLTRNGKPEMLYVGAEYCPYCAAERWAMAVALSRFGTLSNLHFIRSTSTDTYSNTSTLTFYKSSYVSKYLAFHPVESYTVTNKVLQVPSAAEQALLSKYGQGSFPFVDIDGKYIVSGAQYLPTVLGSLATEDPKHFGLTWAAIAKDLQSASNPVAQSILGTANHITAAICKATNDQPSNVCTSAAVTAIGGGI